MLQRYLDGLTTPELQLFLQTHEEDDTRSFVLKHREINGIPAGIIADQLSGRQKAKIKLPIFYQTRGIVYPPSLNLEQCSSEQTARLKSNILLENRSAELMRGADLTGGFGVDAYFMSLVCKSLDYVESNEALGAIAKNNHAILGAKNIRYSGMTSEEFLQRDSRHFDFIYIDPSRRSGSKKVFRLADCQPDPVGLLPHIFEKSDQLLLKASPLLDIQHGLKELGRVIKIFVVAVDDECKEILYLCNSLHAIDPPVVCINISTSTGEKEEFRFTLTEEREIESKFSDPLSYLYEPHPWILKAGAFKTAGNRFDLFKLQSSTHLYTSDQLMTGFPGKIFRIETNEVSPRSLDLYSPERKANIIVRNYPLSPDELKAKFKIRDGGDKYIVGFSGRKKKYLVIASRVD